MRAYGLTLVAVLCLISPDSLRADEPPAEPPAKDEAGSGPKADHEKLLAPAAAWKAINAELQGLPAAERGRELRRQTYAFLEGWKARGKTAAAGDLYALGLMQRQALRPERAVASFRGVSMDASAPTDLRDAAAATEALLLLNPRARKGLDSAGLRASTERLRAYAAAMAQAERTGKLMSLRANVAGLLALCGEMDESLELYLKATLEEPKAARWVHRSVVRNLIARTHSMDGYPALRASARAAMLILRHQQQAVIRAAAERVQALRAEGDESGTKKAESAVATARKDLERIEAAGRPFGMLGKPAPPWTLVKAFGDVKQVTDLEGKVVVLDFWATWCSWCVKSFPGIRDLLSEYADRGLVVVGVTASARSVYEHRYDIDADHVAKARKQGVRYRPKVGARRARAGQPADGEAVFEDAAYRLKELEILATFLRNHEVTWPVVMIDNEEPGPKYALTGWPHAVVLDRQGRVRYFKYGPLLRDDPKTQAALKGVLEDLLAEPKAK